MRHRNSVEFAVFGRYALFSDPITRVGGEKFSYQVPTYQAVKGILESVYWKPTLIWYIDEIRVMNKIQTESKGIRPMKYDSSLNDLSYYTYLRDVRYQVLAHFEWNMYREELSHDQNEHKHHNIAKRMIQRGGRRDIFLGTRECQGYVKPCLYGEDTGFYDGYGEINFGLMVHGFNYPDETGKDELSVRLWKDVLMKDGRIAFPHPSSPVLATKFIKPMKKKEFVPGVNFTGHNESELDELSSKGGATP